MKWLAVAQIDLDLRVERKRLYALQRKIDDLATSAGSSAQAAYALFVDASETLRYERERWHALHQEVVALGDKRYTAAKLSKWWRQRRRRGTPELSAATSEATRGFDEAERRMRLLLVALNHHRAEVDVGVDDEAIIFTLLETASSWRFQEVLLDFWRWRFAKASTVGVRRLQQLFATGGFAPAVRAALVDSLYALDGVYATRLLFDVMANASIVDDDFRWLVLPRTITWEKNDRAGAIGGALQDRCARVRQRAVVMAIDCGEELDAATHCIQNDDDEAVRGAWLRALLSTTETSTMVRALGAAAVHLSATDANIGVFYRALASWLVDVKPPVEVLVAMKQLLNARPAEQQDQWWFALANTTDCLACADTQDRFYDIRQRLGERYRGERVRLPYALDDRTQKILTALAGLGSPLFAKASGSATTTVQCGARRRIALWRVLHELRHPRFDKRSGHSHTTGRHYFGSHWFLSLVGGEVTRTTVPGEPVVAGEEGHVSPEVFGPAEYANVTDAVLVVTPSGCARLSRTSSRLPLLWTYGALDEERFSALQAGAHDVEAYERRAAERAGVTVRWMAKATSGSRSMLPLSYFFSIGGNGVVDLLAVALAITLGLLLRAFWVLRKIRTYRSRIPLVVGGWGSRGKSGTERLKTALFHGLGLRVVAKTTGTVAAFLSTRPGEDAVEVPIFRPFQKASIWEQVRIMRHAADSGADVMLWECMALTPRYVEVLQLDWMRDDIATITNTYPDHEDIQGPSGQDVAETISRFIPKNSCALSSEQQHMAVLRGRAAERQTQLGHVHQAEALLIPGDIRDGFPYLAHPMNLALTCRLATDLGVDEAVALMLMRDFVVADIGVLRIYEAEQVGETSIRFANAMAANERAGFLASLESITGELGEDGLVLVVNNRIDRPARSRVFAEVVARDVAPTGVVVIGSATREFAKLYENALREVEAKWRTSSAPKDELRQRIIGATLCFPAGELDAVDVAHVEDWSVEVLEAELAKQATPRAEGLLAIAKAVFRTTKDTAKLAAFFVSYRLASLTVLDDAGPEKILNHVAAALPAGAGGLAFGVQNIKGPGMRLVDHFAARRVMRGRLSALRSAGDNERARIIAWFLTQHIPGDIRADLHDVLRAVPRLSTDGKRLMEYVTAPATTTTDASHSHLSAFVERHFSYLLMVRNRRAADKILLRLDRGVITPLRAAELLRKLAL